MRLDAYVAQQWPEQSRSTWLKRIKAGHVTVNGTVCMSGKYEVKESDDISAPELEPADHGGKSIPIIFENDDVIVLNKPVGMLTHSKGALNDEFTVAEFVRSRSTYKSDTNRPGIVHRLDRATSGVIVCAKNDEAASMLARQFNQRTLKKTYVAVVSRHPKEPTALLELPISRNPSRPSTFRVDANGKTADTAYETVRQNNKESLLVLKPRSGRTHQLRVHMAYLGCPIVGDDVYGGTPADRLYLHAHMIELTIPGGERKTFESELPGSFDERMSQA